MALKSKNIVMKAMKEGDKLEGYLISNGEAEFPKQNGQPGVDLVPKLVLQEKKSGELFSVLLGAAVKDDVKTLVLHQFTVVKKGASRKTRRGMNVNDWSLMQDNEDVLRA